MSAMKLAVKAFTFVLCLVAAGCSVLSPQPDRTTFYILTPIADGQLTHETTRAPLTIGVGPVSFPEYLRRSEVVTRVGANRIELSDEKRWAEPLDKNFMRVLAENLATLLDTQRIEKYPWPLATRVDYQIEVDVQQFETTDAGQSQLAVSWIIRNGLTHQILSASKTIAVAPAAGESGASAALSSDLATLSKDIAARIDTLAQRRRTAGEAANSASVL